MSLRKLSLHNRSVLRCLVAFTMLLGHVVHCLGAEEKLRFGRDVLPILSTNCFACHGPDESVRKGNLRLDLESDAKAPHDTGTPIVAGDVEQSTLMQRIVSTDPELIMPPPDAHKEIKPEQIEILRRWISEGAEWGRHWSFEPVVRPAVSSSSDSHAIDVLAEQTLKRHGLTLRPSATPEQLVRRLSLDLTGLPPTLDMAQKFADNPTEQAYEGLVDALLAQPAFGEHWARMWMDLARYADTKGYEKDLGRTMWPWRDWLVRSLNADMPLDQLTVEQLAGDLLPSPSADQLIATAFHRNTMSNDEGGTDDEEFRSIAVKDRVDTTLQVWMGLTAGCAKCHTHKYDPISQHEYYALYDIFNQTQDADRYDDAPTFEIPSAEVEEERAKVRSEITSLRSKLDLARKKASEASNWQFGTIIGSESESGATLQTRDDSSVFVDGRKAAEDVYTVQLALQPGKHAVLRLEVIPEPFADGQSGVGRNPRDPNFVLSELEVELEAAEGSIRLSLLNARADFSQNGWPVQNSLDGDRGTGWAVSPQQREYHVAMFSFAEPLLLKEAATLKIIMRQHYGDSLVLRRFRFSTHSEDSGQFELPSPSDDEKKLNTELAAASKRLQEASARIARIPVMRSMEKEKYRVTKVHRRGNFLDPGDQVVATFPAAFHKPPQDLEVNRLVLAQWLMSPENTLTPRVWANRIWARLFGLGLVETEEDFGALGALPSHPELLDWLACEYRDNGWSLKRLLKVIVMSRTYRQSSEVTAELRERDPRNIWLSRGARFRLSAEAVRDQTLATSGLLSAKIGGPPVMPPQPDGLWRSTYNGQKWINAEGEDRFRRGLYTYLKRTTPYPSMTTFDGGSGEVCQIRRIRTNTPLQALVTLNDPVYLEAAAAFAGKILKAPGDASEKAARALQTALIRPIADSECLPLVRLQTSAASEFEASPEKADALIKATRAQVPDGVSATDFASWIIVASTVLNLDEYLCRN